MIGLACRSQVITVGRPNFWQLLWDRRTIKNKAIRYLLKENYDKLIPSSIMIIKDTFSVLDRSFRANFQAMSFWWQWLSSVNNISIIIRIMHFKNTIDKIYLYIYHISRKDAIYLYSKQLTSRTLAESWSSIYHIRVHPGLWYYLSLYTQSIPILSPPIFCMSSIHVTLFPVPQTAWFPWVLFSLATWLYLWNESIWAFSLQKRQKHLCFCSKN